MVGGAVRDAFLGIDPKDIDVEVFGLSGARLTEVLSQFGRVDLVGQSFGIIKVTTADGWDFDFSLPRTESNAAAGHRGFIVEVSETLTIEQAARRRDFTFNAMSVNVLSGELVDPFNGLSDLQNGILRPTSEAFGEDPLRVLRGMQFAARMGLQASPEFIEVAKSLVTSFSEISKERFFGEFWKLAAKGVKPSAGLEILRQTGWIVHFPELSDLVDCPQDETWHPEGCVWTHTCMVADAAAEIAIRENFTELQRGTLVLAGIAHDFGKPATTVRNAAGRWSAPGHDTAGVPLVHSFFGSMAGVSASIIEEVADLTRLHMRHTNKEGITAKAAARIARDMKTSVQMLSAICEADHSGRHPLPKGLPKEAAELCALIADAQAQSLDKPLILGRDLLAMGLQPGKQIGIILAELQRMQFEDGITQKDTLLTEAKRLINKSA